MPADVIMPALGMAQETGKVLRWLKADGEAVAKGEPLLEVETDKVTVEIEAPADGTLAGVTAEEGAEVPVGTAIAFVLAEGEERSATPVPVETEPRGGARGAAEAAARDGAAATAPPPAVRPAAAARLAEGAPARARARRRPRRARRQRPEGRRRRRRRGGAGAALPEPPAVGPAGGAGSRCRRSGGRWPSGRSASWQEVPHFVLTRDVDASRLRAGARPPGARPGCERVTHHRPAREALRGGAAAPPAGERELARRRDRPGPGVNVGDRRRDRGRARRPGRPRRRRARLSPRSPRGAREVVDAARAGRLRPDDVQGGTFTISNLGMYGVDAFQAIVNAPQAAILAVGRIVERPVAVDGEVVVRPVLTLTVSFDHRVVDGARGAEFLDTLASLVEEPAGLVSIGDGTTRDELGELGIARSAARRSGPARPTRCGARTTGGRRGRPPRRARTRWSARSPAPSRRSRRRGTCRRGSASRSSSGSRRRSPRAGTSSRGRSRSRRASR